MMTNYRVLNKYNENKYLQSKEQKMLFIKHPVLQYTYMYLHLTILK